MIAVFRAYRPHEEIPILRHLKNRKLVKYLNRETMAAVVAAGELNEIAPLARETPFYYATGRLEYEDYGLPAIVAASRDETGRFSPERFIGRGIAAVSPLNQFKVLQNMPLSFVSINFGLAGDNAVVYASAAALVRQALCSRGREPMLLGAGKTYRDGRVASGFALANREDLEQSPMPDAADEGVGLMAEWARTAAV